MHQVLQGQEKITFLDWLPGGGQMDHCIGVKQGADKYHIITETLSKKN